MGTNASFNEIFDVANRPDLRETGGGHNQKGIDFQRHWAVLRMFELEGQDVSDFLFLFESIQDIAELNSSSNPTNIVIYQVKKKERKDWSWAELTGIPAPKKASTKPIELDAEKVTNSPLAKLYGSVTAFQGLNASGYFISNMGCDLKLADNTNAATSLPTNLSNLSPELAKLLFDGLALVHKEREPKLSHLNVKRVVLHVDDPEQHLAGIVHSFLMKRSPRHAGQARALVDALIAKISPLGRKTDSCRTFEEMRLERGFSRDEFQEAIGDLESLPDVMSILDVWCSQLSAEGMDFMTITTIKLAAAKFYSKQVAGNVSIKENSLILDCAAWIEQHSPGPQLRPYLEQACAELVGKYPQFREPDILAHVAIQAIKKCVDPTSESS